MTLGPVADNKMRSEKSASFVTMVSPLAVAYRQISLSLQSGPRS